MASLRTITLVLLVAMVALSRGGFLIISTPATGQRIREPFLVTVQAVVRLFRISTSVWRVYSGPGE